MKISEKQLNPTSKIIYLSGRLDAHLVDMLEPAIIEELEDSNLQNLALDVKDVVYLGSSGIKLFLYINQKMMVKKGLFVLLHITPSNMRLLESMEIADFFKYANSNEEVMELFENG